MCSSRDNGVAFLTNTHTYWGEGPCFPFGKLYTVVAFRNKIIELKVTILRTLRRQSSDTRLHKRWGKIVVWDLRAKQIRESLKVRRFTKNCFVEKSF